MEQNVLPEDILNNSEEESCHLIEQVDPFFGFRIELAVFELLRMEPSDFLVEFVIRRPKRWTEHLEMFLFDFLSSKFVFHTVVARTPFLAAVRKLPASSNT
jgi:hypothetical protein